MVEVEMVEFGLDKPTLPGGRGSEAGSYLRLIDLCITQPCRVGWGDGGVQEVEKGKW